MTVQSFNTELLTVLFSKLKTHIYIYIYIYIKYCTKQRSFGSNRDRLSHCKLYLLLEQWANILIFLYILGWTLSNGWYWMRSRYIHPTFQKKILSWTLSNGYWMHSKYVHRTFQQKTRKKWHFCEILHFITRKFMDICLCLLTYINPYPTAFPYGNGMVLHFYQQQESSMTKTVHKVINKGLKTYV